MKIILIKHGKTDFNDQGKRQGSTDLSLNDRGIKEISILKEEFNDTIFDVIFSSPLKRALESAQILFPKQNIVKNDLLREFDFGELEGVRFSEPLEKFPENAVEEYNGKKFLLPNKGETFENVVHRVQRFLQLIVHGFGPDTTIAIVTHATIIEIMQALIQGKQWSACLGENTYMQGYMEIEVPIV